MVVAAVSVIGRFDLRLNMKKGYGGCKCLQDDAETVDCNLRQNGQGPPAKPT